MERFSNLMVSYAESSSYFSIFHHISISDELYQQHSLTGAKRREWMGCWGLLGLLIVSQWIIPENSLRLAPVRQWDMKWLYTVMPEFNNQHFRSIVGM